MHLVVFPGLSSPYHAKYRPVYDFLRQRAKECGVSMSVALYPGQQSERGECVGELDANGAFEAATTLIKNVAASGECFATLGISFGSTVSLVAAQRLQGMELWKRAILWGPIPHHLMCRTFIKGRDPNLGQGTRIADSPDNTFLHENPIECLLPSAWLPVDVGLGGADKYVQREYLVWLQKLCESLPKPPIRKFVYLEGCGHNVSADDPNHGAYSDFVFGALT